MQYHPPPGAGHGQNAREWRGLALFGGQDAAGGLPRAPASTLPATPSHARAPAPFSGRVPGVQYQPPRGRSRAKRRGSGGERRCPGCRRPQGVCPEPRHCGSGRQSTLLFCHSCGASEGWEHLPQTPGEVVLPGLPRPAAAFPAVLPASLTLARALSSSPSCLSSRFLLKALSAILLRQASRERERPGRAPGSARRRRRGTKSLC